MHPDAKISLPLNDIRILINTTNNTLLDAEQRRQIFKIWVLISNEGDTDTLTLVLFLTVKSVLRII